MKTLNIKCNILPRLYCLYLAVCAVMFISPIVCFAAPLQQYKGMVNVSTTVSDGKYNLEEVIKIARQAGMRIVLVTDRDHMNWEYGAWPLRNIIKRSIQDRSTALYGIQRYLQNIKAAQNKYNDMVIVPGAESAPFYFWSGSILKGNFTINAWHKHILAVGLKNPRDYACLPVIGNEHGLRRGFNFFKLWPLIIGVLIGVFVKRKVSKAIGLVLCGIFLINNAWFFNYAFSQYQGDLGALPYQIYIDYVKSKGGLTFWAHPEAENYAKNGMVKIATGEHVGELIHSYGYTGFAVFYEGYKIMGKPGGVWDALLMRYCAGQRLEPIWAVGCSEYDNIGQLNISVKDLQTIFLVPRLNMQEVLAALAKGKMYVVRGSQATNFVLDDFTVINSETKTTAVVGETLNKTVWPIIHVKGRFSNGANRKLEIKLICNGKIVKTFKKTAPMEIIFSAPRPKNKTYYRLDIYGQGLRFVTNPIFVE